MAMNQQQPLPILTTPEEQAFARALAGTAAKVIDCEKPEVLEAWRMVLKPHLERLEREEEQAAEEQTAIEHALFAGDVPAVAPPPTNANNENNAPKEERVVRRLLRLFKHEGLFAWVDSPPCPLCGGPASFSRVEPPNAAERAEDPSVLRVEVHACVGGGSGGGGGGACHEPEEARFPRHASALKLLQTRKGRCGEWAHAFLAALRSQGVEARHVQDREDHVWTEYYWRPSCADGRGGGGGGGGEEAEGRWVHADCCEGAHDAPHTYERGWGKSLTFAVAVGRLGAADVSLRYAGVAAAAEARAAEARAGAAGAEAQARALRERRRQGGVRESWLLPNLDRLSWWLRRRLPPPAAGGGGRAAELRRRRSRRRRRRELADALDLVLTSFGLPEAGGAEASSSSSLQGGRTSGSAAWRAARGEDGGGGDGAAAAPAPPPPAPAATTATPWAWARDDGGGPPLAAFAAACGRVSGGAARASADNAPAGETAAVALLARGGKWLAFLPFPPAAAAVATAPAAAAAVADDDDDNSGGDSNSADAGHWIEYRLPARRAPVSLLSYDLISANDAPERDPSAWTLERWCEGEDGGEERGRWVAADAPRQGERFERRRQLRSFFLPPPGAPASRAWRLRVTGVADGAASNSVQLGGWRLYGRADGVEEEEEEEEQGRGEESAAAAAAAAAAALAAADAARALRALASSSSSSSCSTPATTVVIPGARALRLAGDAPSRAVLAAAGFRPVQGGEAGPSALAADAGARGARGRAEAALAALLGSGAAANHP